MPSMEIKQNHINRSIKIIEGRIRGGEKQREKHQVENNYKHGRY